MPGINTYLYTCIHIEVELDYVERSNSVMEIYGGACAPGLHTYIP